MTDDKMPPLPEPSAWYCYWRSDNDSSSWDQWHDASDPMPAVWDGDPPDEVAPHYTADQMHAYARAYAAEQVRELVEALAELADANSTLNARSWPGGPADFEQQRDRMRAAWVSARALIAKHKGTP